MVFGEQMAAGSSSVGVAGGGEDLGVMDEAVDHRVAERFIAEHLAPSPEGQVPKLSELSELLRGVHPGSPPEVHETRDILARMNRRSFGIGLSIAQSSAHGRHL